MENLNKKITIIIPNGEETLITKSISSLLNQVYKELEILTVNYNSSFTDKRIKNINTKEQDYLQICKLLMKQATGEYISFLIPGNTVSIDFYRSMASIATKNNLDIVLANFVLEIETEKFIYNMLDIPLENLENTNIFDRYIRQNGLNDLWNILDNKLFSKSLITKTLKDLKNISFASNDFLLLNFFLHKNATSMAKIENDVLIIPSLPNLIDNSSLIDTFKVMETNLPDNKYLKNINEFKNLCANILKKQNISLPNFEVKSPVEDIDYYSLIQTKWNDGLEKIKIALTDKDIKVVSFDIFDTLVTRPFLEPTDLFDIMDKYFRKLTDNKTATEFKNIRTTSEALARKKKKLTNNSAEDITLDEIYTIIKERYRLNDNIITKLKAYELELELRFCKQRKSAFELYELALYLKKKVICTSDMYLDANFLAKMLKNCHYKNISKIYVSSEYNKTKASGNLYKIMKNAENVDYKNIIHIGDNYISDFKNATNKEIKAFQLFKAVDIFLDKYKTGNLSSMLVDHLPFWLDNSNGLLFNGIRVIIGMVANTYFDNPFKTFNNKTDFNASPYLIGYYCLGSYMFGLIKWILDDMQDKNYEKLVFMARDGYLPMECYKILKPFYQDTPKEEYLYISRKALIPIIIQNKMDFYKLTETLNIENINSFDVIKYINNLIDFNESKFKKICTEKNINPKSKFKTIEEFNSLIDIIIENFYNEEKHQKNLKLLTDYFKDIYGHNSATFDIGYSARPSYFISNLLKEPIDTYFCNIVSTQALRHAKMGNFKLKTFFDGRPSTIGHAYELLLSASAPSCISYDIEKDKVVPKFEEYKIKDIDYFAIKTLQDAAISFVKDIANIFNSDIDILFFQNYYISLPFLAFMNSSKNVDKYPFHSILFEDDLVNGSNKMVRLWQDELMTRNQHNLSSLLNITDNEEDNYFSGNNLVYNSNVNLKNVNKIKRL